MLLTAADSNTHGARVTLAGVRRVYDNHVTALEGFTLDVAPGEFLAILGPSGCGKSTLLRLIAGLDQPQDGAVSIDGPPPSRPAVGSSGARQTGAPVAFVFQDAHLLPWRSVLDNVSLPLELLNVGRSERRQSATRALEQVGLAETLGRYPFQLSGGQRMRVSVARAMVTRPRLLLLDEPFAAIDEINRQHLDEQLRQLWQTLGMTVIFVTHSTTEAVFLAERAVVMSKRLGRIMADVRVELPTERTAGLRGTAPFAALTRVIYDALERGQA